MEMAERHSILPGLVLSTMFRHSLPFSPENNFSQYEAKLFNDGPHELTVNAALWFDYIYYIPSKIVYEEY